MQSDTTYYKSRHYNNVLLLTYPFTPVINCTCDFVKCTTTRAAEEFHRRENNAHLKSKLHIAKELFDTALEKNIKSPAVTFDSWYASTDFIEHIRTNEKYSFSEIKSNRNIFLDHPGKKTHSMVKSDGLSDSRRLVTPIKKHYSNKIQSIKHKTSDRSEVSYKAYSFEAKPKGGKIPMKFVVILGKWNKEEDNNVCIFVTNKLHAPSRTLIENYLLRWGIVYCFKELKDAFYFNHYQPRHIDRIKRY